MNWSLLVPVDGAVLRKAVLGKMAELGPEVKREAQKFADPSHVYSKTEVGKEDEWLSVHAETIPRHGVCYISASLARYLGLFHIMTHEEARLAISPITK